MRRALGRWSTRINHRLCSAQVQQGTQKVFFLAESRDGVRSNGGQISQTSNIYWTVKNHVFHIHKTEDLERENTGMEGEAQCSKELIRWTPKQYPHLPSLASI
jgi:hypothetical protein